VGRRTGAGYSLAIVDDGVGMSDEALAEANKRLSGRESFTVAPSRYLGHYVVGVQAARLGVSVELLHSPTGGVTAQVELSAILADEQAPVPSAAAPVADEPVVEVVADAPTELVEAELVEAEPVVAPEDVADDAAGRHEFVDEPTGERFVPQVGAARTRASADMAPTAALETGPVAVSEMSGSIEPETVTTSGYKRRVRGANAPRTDVFSARRAEAGDEDGPDDEASPAESVRNLLTGLQAGAERARSGRDAATEGDA
jgi:hypothetical protein